jgi:hypothetical protein
MHCGLGWPPSQDFLGLATMPDPLYSEFGWPPSLRIVDLAGTMSRHLGFGKYARPTLLWPWLAPSLSTLGLATMRMGLAWVKLSFYYILKNKKTKVLLGSLKNSILEGNYVILHWFVFKRHLLSSFNSLMINNSCKRTNFFFFLNGKNVITLI